MNCITGYCIIKDYNIILNGKKLNIKYNENEDIESYLKKVYKQYNLKYPKFYKMDVLSKLAFICSELLLINNRLSENYNSEKIGIIASNSSSTLYTDIEYFKTINDFPSPGLFVYTLPNILIAEICIKNKFKGETNFFVSEKFDVDLLYNYTKILFDNNILNTCILIWIEYNKKTTEVFMFLVEKTDKNKLKFNRNNIKKIYDYKGAKK